MSKEGRITIRMDDEVLKELRQRSQQFKQTSAQLGREAIAIYLDVLNRRMSQHQDGESGKMTPMLEKITVEKAG